MRYTKGDPVKTCRHCGERIPPGRRTVCGECQQMRDRERYLRRFYGLTHSDYQRMYTAQKGRCAICRARQDRLVIDHDHASGRIRGLLCQVCNTGLGCLGDSAETLERAWRYLSAA